VARAIKTAPFPRYNSRESRTRERAHCFPIGSSAWLAIRAIRAWSSPSPRLYGALRGRLSGSPFCKLRRAIYSSDARSLQAISKTWRALAGDGLPHKTSEPVLVFASSKLGLSSLGQLPEKSDDAIIILRLAIELAEGFLADSDKPEPAKVLTIVRDPA